MEILGKLLGGVPRVKSMRLFLLNPDTGFENTDIVARCRITAGNARKATTQLHAMGFIKKHSFIKETKTARGKVVKKRRDGWFLNPDFPYIKELKPLLVEGEFVNHTELARRFKGVGRVHLLVVSGIFIQNSESRLDLLVVGDNLKKNAVQRIISVLESELGKELSYALFETPDFKYRMSMYDKLLRDVFDYPHKTLSSSKDFATFALPKETF